VKVARTDAGARMLRAEAAHLSRVREAPGIPRLVRFEDGDRPCLVLPWLGDRSFRDILRGLKTEDDRGRAVALFIEVVHSVAWIHRMGLAHGDLKPENIVIGDDGLPWLVDFGLAREIQRLRREARLSQSLRSEEGLAGGTLAYLPPEAVKGADPSPRADVYALGVMLHEVLLGRRPDKAVSPDELRVLLDDEVVELLLRALAFDPADRFPRATDLHETLHDLRPRLAATGPDRKLIAFKRTVRAMLAAFFVALRYTSVFALLALYAYLIIASLVTWEPIFLGLLPFVLIQTMVRWEGPESVEEARLRRLGQVVERRPGQ
jgi:serine/threonine protein kinase